ncbi:MAG: hypothetical protein OEM97_11380 [Acidimicrobiia bacterium]|nr:hypothetical protein [Acidimicrobiia bacterium]
MTILVAECNCLNQQPLPQIPAGGGHALAATGGRTYSFNGRRTIAERASGHPGWTAGVAALPHRRVP